MHIQNFPYLCSVQHHGRRVLLASVAGIFCTCNYGFVPPCGVLMHPQPTIGVEQRVSTKPFLLKLFNTTMKTNQPVLSGLIAQLETIRTEFYENSEFAEPTDQETFENAINEAQTAIGFVIASNIVAQARNNAANQKGGSHE